MAFYYIKYSKLSLLMLKVYKGFSLNLNVIPIQRSLSNYQFMNAVQENQYFYSTYSENGALPETVDNATMHVKELQVHLIQDAKTLNSMAHLFPSPKQTFNQFYIDVFRKEKNEYKHSLTYLKTGPQHDPVYCCTLHLNGPSYGEFFGYAKAKKVAETIAVAKALSVLYEEGHITMNGLSTSNTVNNGKGYSKILKKEILKESLPIRFSSNNLQEMQELIGHYKTKLQPFIQSELGNYNASHIITDNEMYLDLITCKRRSLLEDIDDCKYIKRNSFLFKNLRRKEEDSLSYPILESRDEILKKINENQFVIIQGGTGCGKSTQVPQMIFDEWIRKGIGSNCNIVVCQPRRIAARSLASWLAKNRRERLGQSIGFKMRLEELLPKHNGGIVFYTSGTLRQVMMHNTALQGVSHIIVDEIHERTADIDILLALLKSIRQNQPNLKIILMSATIDLSKLSKYFDCNSDNIITITGKSFPVKAHYIDNLKDSLDIFVEEKILKNMSGKSKPIQLEHNLIIDVVRAIHEKKPPGAILIFVPGWSDIMKILDALSSSCDLWALPLHSSLSSNQQKEVFKHPPEGMRKVIISTNIAETSITIDDIVYVVDSGMLNISKYDSQKDLCIFGTTWITKANAIQRAGRAGRVQAGEVYCIYSQKLYEKFGSYPVPEIVEQPLESVCLQTKALLTEWNIREFLEQLIDPPPHFAVRQAISNLCHLGLLSHDGDCESLTILGKCVSKVSTYPSHGKALIYASILRCFETMLNIVSFEGNMGTLFEEKLSHKQFRELKEKFCSSNDLIAMSKIVTAIDTSLEHFKKHGELYPQTVNGQESNSHIDPTLILPHISPVQFKIYQKVRKALSLQCQKILHPYFEDLRVILKEDFETLNLLTELDDNLPKKSSQESHLLVEDCFLASSLDILRRFTKNVDLKLYTDSGQKIIVQKSSVLLSGSSSFGISDLALANNIIYSQERGAAIASDLCTVKPLSAVLFYGPNLELKEKRRENEVCLKIKGHNISFCLDNEQMADCVMELRNIVKEIVDYVIIYSESKNKFNVDFWSSNTNLHSDSEDIGLQDDSSQDRDLNNSYNNNSNKVNNENKEKNNEFANDFQELNHTATLTRISMDETNSSFYKVEFRDIIKFISNLSSFLGKPT